MGYTHYWKNHKRFSDSQWAELTAGAKFIVKHCITHDVPLAWEYDNLDKPPQIDDEVIRFNGVGDDGHETFMLSRSPDDFSFCKTAEKPYDLAVVAILGLAAGITLQFKWSSDGDAADHVNGLTLAGRFHVPAAAVSDRS